MSKLLGALCATAVLATALSGTPATAAGPVQVKPVELTRGPDVAVPHIQGGRVVDGEERVDVPGTTPYLLGVSGPGYVVVSLVDETWTTFRVGDRAPVRLLRGPDPGAVVLADGGTKIAVTRSATRGRTVIEVLSVPSGRRVRRDTFAGYPRVLDLDGSTAIVGGPGGGFRWNLTTGRTRLVDSGFVYRADISSNRLASFDKDPYDGGCSSVSTLRSPRSLLWASCREAVREFSPDGRRIVTQHKLTDGLGAGRLWERTVGGGLLASYTVAGYFATVAWESRTDLVLDAYGPRKWAVVRCSEGTCERASSLRRSPEI